MLYLPLILITFLFKSLNKSIRKLIKNSRIYNRCKTSYFHLQIGRWQKKNIFARINMMLLIYSQVEFNHPFLCARVS